MSGAEWGMRNCLMERKKGWRWKNWRKQDGSFSRDLLNRNSFSIFTLEKQKSSSGGSFDLIFFKKKEITIILKIKLTFEPGSNHFLFVCFKAYIDESSLSQLPLLHETPQDYLLIKFLAPILSFPFSAPWVLSASTENYKNNILLVIKASARIIKNQGWLHQSSKVCTRIKQACIFSCSIPWFSHHNLSSTKKNKIKNAS